MSLLMTVVPPSVSTSVRDFTTALSSARCCAPDDNIVCTNVGRPTGIAEIAVEMHKQDERLGVLTARDTDDGDDRDRGPGEQPEDLGQAVELTLQRRPHALRRGDHVGNAAHLGCLTGCGHHEARRSPRHLRVLEHEVRAVAERDVIPGERRVVLGDGRALAGERGLLQLERGGGDDATVGRDDVARLERHDVAGDQVDRLDLLHAAGSPHARMGHLELRKRIDARARVQFLARAHHDVERHQQRHEDARGNLADRDARDRDDHQHDVHRVRQLTQAHGPDAGWRLGRELVRPVLGESPLDLVGVKSMIEVDRQGLERCGAVERIPRGRPGTLLDRAHVRSFGCGDSAIPHRRPPCPFERGVRQPARISRRLVLLDHRMGRAHSRRGARACRNRPTTLVAEGAHIMPSCERRGKNSEPRLGCAGRRLRYPRRG